MNLLFLTPRLPYPPHRGDKLKIYNLLRQVSKHHHVTLISFVASQDELKYVPELEKYCEEVITIHLPAWRSVLNCLLSVFSSVPFQVAYFFSEEMKKAVEKKMSEKDFDVVHVHLIRMAQYALSKSGRTARVLDLTDAGSLYLERFLNTTGNPFKRLFLKEEHYRLTRYERVLERFDLSLVCSTVDRNALFRNAPHASIDLLYNGIDLEYFSSDHPATRSSPHRIICTGNMSYFPNEDGVVYFVSEILPLIKKQVPDAETYIVGQHPTGSVRSLAGQGVTVTGFVPDIKEYYLTSALAIAPIRFGAGTLNKILEPMALGIPVVTTSLGVEGLPVENGRDVLIADTPNEFASAVVRLLNDAQLRRTVGENAQKIVRSQYGWDVIGGRLNDIYEQVHAAQLQ